MTRQRKPRGQPLPHADEIIALVEGGMTVAAACRSDPAFPTWDAFVKYFRRDPVRADRLQQALRTRAVNATGKPGARLRRIFTAADYDAALQVLRSSNRALKSAVPPPLPSYNACWQRARTDTAFAEELRAAVAEREANRNSRFSDALELIGANPTVGVTKLLKQAGQRLPSRQTLDHHFNRNPSFAALLAPVRQKRKLVQSHFRKQQTAKPVYTTNVLAKLLGANEFYAIAEKAVPKNLDPWDRDDIKAEMVTAMISGTLSLEGAAKSGKQFAGEFMAQQGRQRFKSLDTSAFGPSGENWVATLSTDDVGMYL